jgi:hypothetical protein
VSLYTRVPHPHLEHRRKTGPVKTADQLPGGFNTRLALRITACVGSMGCAYGFAILTLISLPAAIFSGSVIVIVAWIAQTFLQLVLLSVILLGQNITSAAADKRAEQTYNDADATLHECLQLQQHLQAQDVILERVLAHAEKLAGATPQDATSAAELQQ